MPAEGPGRSGNMVDLADHHFFTTKETEEKSLKDFFIWSWVWA